MNDDFLKKHQIRPDAEFVENLYQKLEATESSTVDSFVKRAGFGLRRKFGVALALFTLALMTIGAFPATRVIVFDWFGSVNGVMVGIDPEDKELLATGNDEAILYQDENTVKIELGTEQTYEDVEIKTEFVDEIEFIEYDDIENRFPDFVFPTQIPARYQLSDRAAFGNGILSLNWSDDQGNTLAYSWGNHDLNNVVTYHRDNTVTIDNANILPDNRPYEILQTLNVDQEIEEIIVFGRKDGVDYNIHSTASDLDADSLVSIFLVGENRLQSQTAIVDEGDGGTDVSLVELFALGGQTTDLDNASIMAESGMTWVKFQHKWSCGNDPAELQHQIDSAHANGLKVLYSVVGTPYPNSIDFDCYTNFLSDVAELGADGIEVWSEMNIDFQWPVGAIDPEAYVRNMLQPAYIKIKDANPDTLVISGAPAPTGFFAGGCSVQGCDDQPYIQEMAEAGAADYLDCVGVHYNAGATSPSATSGHPAAGSAGHYSWYFEPMIDVYFDVLEKPLCFTELGYLSGEDYGGVPGRFSWASNTTVDQHAEWLAEAVEIGVNSGKVQMITVFNVDFTLYSEDPQAGFAMIRQDGSCPACDLLADVMAP